MKKNIIILFVCLVLFLVLGIIFYKPNIEEPKISENQIGLDADEKIFVEKYFKDNIKSITTDKSVLGGSWYVVSIAVNPMTDSGEVVYEDGHIQTKASFVYEYDKKAKRIIIKKFEIKS